MVMKGGFVVGRTLIYIYVCNGRDVAGRSFGGYMATPGRELLHHSTFTRDVVVEGLSIFTHCVPLRSFRRPRLCTGCGCMKMLFDEKQVILRYINSIFSSSGWYCCCVVFTNYSL